MKSIKSPDPLKYSMATGFSTLLCFILLLISTDSFSQNSHFRNFSSTEGLCHPFVYGVSQDKNGFIWIGTGEGLCRYDGIDFTPGSNLDSLPVDVVNVSYADSLDNLWFGFNNGMVCSYGGNYFIKHAFKKDISTSVTGIAQDIVGNVIIATQNMGTFKLNEQEELVPTVPSFKDKLISTIHSAGNKLLIGTHTGLLLYDLNNENDTLPREIEELSYITVQVISDAYSNNSYWVGTEDAGLFLVQLFKDSVDVKNVGDEEGLGYENVQDVMFDSDSNLWIATYTSGLLKCRMSESEPWEIEKIEKYNTKTGFSSNFVKSVFEDREGNLWIGTYGGGVTLQTNLAFDFKNYEEYGISRNIVSLALNKNLLWLGGENNILQFDKLNNKYYLYTTGNGLPQDLITSLYYRDGNLWAGTSSNGIYILKEGSKKFTRFFSSSSSISNSINYITGDADNIYVATKDGIYIINKDSNQQIHYNTINGLPHNDIEHLFLDSENRLFFATRTNGIYEINVRGEVEEYFTVGKYELDFNSIAQDKKGNIWVSTNGQGVFLLLADSVMNITVRDGLKSNYCYSLVAADSLYIWVGHRLGLSRININNLSVTVFDSDNGITGDCNLNAAKLATNKVLYFGTTDGLVTYDIREGLAKKVDPKTNIVRILISDKEYDPNKPIVLPYGAYKLQIDYIGLNYADPEAVTYQYKLEGYDLGWSQKTNSRSVIYPRIEDGNYTFLLKSFGTEGDTLQTPIDLKIRIKLPVWKTWWFISMSVIILVLIVIVIIKYRERRQKQLQEYLEQRLDERTREVVEQKEEIEIKNRDITDSINYAQRIQTSILPPIKRLQKNFSGSFIFYQPRDIVSGDFYWFDRINNNKFVIVCADSTGHGVPGAFMSMIGTTLIKDISMRDGVNAPSDMLRELDHELRSTLNQNIEAEQSNDGMDIIVCEIDVKTNYLRYASAMRPMIVYKGGEQIYIKGSRSSVGGHYDKEDKNFKDEGIQLDKGDLIYMFSDGYPDQFGGPIGKKFKMVRLKNLLKDIYQKPMEEQYEYVKSTFNLWKEDFEQVDDVLFMGIKI
ncbi:MAG: SpoIIE family protein phosphatase [Bacteroidales bacterium]|nr:SpoIIE family protein phosphatase [Bacteroidales bacterium]